ncbi:leucyl aminopeptidase family protein [Ascidiimonas sp. W6]|uniref:leucyl aminopeptidase family protein n=1 Tax=Ascidiimonas meishanensis TaxID=3128903 RepID=UPI0030EF837C
MINSKITEGLDSSGLQLILVPEEDVKNTLQLFLGNKLPPLFKATYNEIQLYEKEETLFFLVGIGSKTSISDIRNVALNFSVKFGKKIQENELNIHIPKSYTINQRLSFYNGLFLGAYSIKEENDHFLFRKDVEIKVATTDYGIAKEAKVLANAQGICMNWLNKPANKKSGPVIADYAVRMANQLGFKCTVLNRQQATAEGLDAYLAVNRASEFDASFIVLEYKHDKAVKKIGLVGKCVTFDTGGISIKPSQNLHYMKSDMGGATAVLGAFHAIAEMQLPIHVIGILPATDNAVSEKAYLPSDVINSHAGKSIEVIDTDAEGRLTLADGLSYVIKKYNPEIVIDIATLTGSAVRTFGYECAALFGNNEELLRDLHFAGEASGEKVWQLPMWETYAESLHSDIADIKNYSGKPIAGAIDAAVFLQNFTHNHNAWAHLDIAGVAFGNTPFGKDKTATGYGVHLLIEYIKRIID